MLTDTPDSAFDKVSMDIMGPLPTTRSKNSYILTIQDLLSKYSLAIPLQHVGAIEVADALTNELIFTFGAPKAILTDQGSHFLNSLMRNIARKFRIKHYRTTAYRPQANGSVERSHQVLWEYLKQFVDKNNEWHKCLKLASLSYNPAYTKAHNTHRTNSCSAKPRVLQRATPLSQTQRTKATRNTSRRFSIISKTHRLSRAKI